MSVVAGFTVVLLEGIFAIYKKVHAINFGIYGVSKVGKTTLHHQIRTRGEGFYKNSLPNRVFR